ncbi:endonuclease III domain-containing protein [Sporolactobacillus sp. Y61]|jgi:endonuclease-3 related protein|uniref:Endonuclease III domain-containing protein n=1 Tax=Sporolactobacillus sp. Y61 TaxID=3160863 RepID=A0AAU8IEQ5_9BACL
MKLNQMERYHILLRSYGPQHWWPAESTFEMLIGAILTQNTSWKNVDLALKRLKPGLTPEKIERMSPETLADCIRPSGFYRLKAERIRSFLAWYRDYHYDPSRVSAVDASSLRNELLDVKGIGRETADAMLVYAFKKPFFIADAYARRFFTRLGDDVPKNYDDFRKQVEAGLPDDLAVYQEYHALIVAHGKMHCRAAARCDGCPFFSKCEARIEKDYQRRHGGFK